LKTTIPVVKPTEYKMTSSETVAVDIGDNEDEDVELIEALETGSLEWFRLHAPLRLLLEAFFEHEWHRAEFGRYENETPKSACNHVTDFWDVLRTAEAFAERLEDFRDPNAEAIVARLRALTWCDG
jgi:hypothetical protein